MDESRLLLSLIAKLWQEILVKDAQIAELKKEDE